MICYGLVIGRAVSDLLLRFGYWQRGKLSVVTVWLLAAR